MEHQLSQAAPATLAPPATSATPATPATPAILATQAMLAAPATSAKRRKSTSYTICMNSKLARIIRRLTKIIRSI